MFSNKGFKSTNSSSNYNNLNSNKPTPNSRTSVPARTQSKRNSITSMSSAINTTNKLSVSGMGMRSVSVGMLNQAVIIVFFFFFFCYLFSF